MTWRASEMLALRLLSMLSRAADKAGLRGSDESLSSNGQQLMVGGDVIRAVDGQAVSDVAELQAIIT